MALPLRALSLAGVLVTTAIACGPPPDPQVPARAAACDGQNLGVCERDLAAAVTAGSVTSKMIAAYVSARAAKDSADPWGRVWTSLSERGQATAAVIDTRPGKNGVSAPGVKVVTSGALPDPAGVTGLDLVLGMGIAAGYDHVVWLGAGDGRRSFELYPRDPLEPLVLGLRSVARDDAAAEHLAKNLELAATVRRAFDQAGSFKYLEAAKETAALTAQVKGRDLREEPVLRARYARSLLTGMGLALDPSAKLFTLEADPAADAETKPPPAAEPSESDTRYGDLLRVLLAESRPAEWKRRGPVLLAAIAEDRRELASASFGPRSACGVVVLPPTFDRPGDIAVSGFLPGALAGARIDAIATTTTGGLPLSAWVPRYEALVGQVERSRLWWLEIGTLLRQRGELAGITAAGSPTHKRVTERALAHIAALREMAEAEPERYAATAELGLAYLPGLLGDDALRAALIDLTQSTTKGKLARAEDPESIAGSLVVGAFTGLSYPSAIQAAHYLALQSAFAAKVKGGLTTKTGWGAAGLFAVDALVRILADIGPNLAFSSEQIVRALSDPGISQPNVAAVVSAAARYAALAKDRPLSALASPAKSTPERAAAREALRKAILGMGAAGEAPPQLVDDVTQLADGMIAILTIVAHRKTPPPGTCSDAGTAGDLEIQHALTKLAEVRGKILQSPRYKSGDGLWTRRARLLVTVLSDAMDLARTEKKGAKKQLAVSAADVEGALTGALREWDEPGARDAIVGIYGLARFFLLNDPAKRYEAGGTYLIQALGGVGKFLRGDRKAGSASMLDAFAEMSGKQATTEDIAGALVTYAKAFYDKGQPDQGDVFLLGTILLTAGRRTAPPKEAIALAAAQKSRIEWALHLFAEVAAAEKTGRPTVAAYSAGARSALEETCAVARVDDTFSVLGAVALWSEGKRADARAALSRVLARGETEGLVVPRLTYQYTEKHDRKMFTLIFGLSQGVGFVDGANSFQVGLGFSTVAERWNKLAVTAASPEETAGETARYYVRAAALAAAYDFLDGDATQGAIDARRALSAVVGGLRLGARTVGDDRAKWAEDARALLAVDAQLAADAGLPLLSGDLWTVVHDALAPDTNDAKLDEVLAQTPIGLAGSKDAEPVIARAKKALRVVAEPLACTTAKVDTLAFEQPACAGYSLALSLRIADVLKKLPRLTGAGKTPEDEKLGCGALRSLDAFLGAADSGTYDPDAFTKAVLDLRASGRVDEASILLARQRRDGHCNPTLIKTARELGRSPALLASARSDMLAVAVKCWVPGPTTELEKDLAALDVETRKLADPMRNLNMLLFTADFSLTAGKPELLLSLVKAPGFVDRFLGLHGNAVVGMLMLHHTAHLLAGEPLDPAATAGAFGLVCLSFPSDERRSKCDELKGMRDATKPIAERKALAKDALTRFLTPQTKPTKTGP